MPWKFIPFGEFKADAGRFANDGLLHLYGVLPWQGTLIPAPRVNATETNAAANIFRTKGAYIHPGTGEGATFHAGSDLVLGVPANDYIYRAATDHSRVTLYDSDTEWWSFCSFGDFVIATNYLDEVQYLDLPASASVFADAITSTFAPQGRFCAPIGPNLFLANLFLPGSYDGLAAGDNPYTLAWSMDDNLRAFGSPRANPEYTGAGYKILLNDLGHITGLVGGDYGIVFQQRGFTRIDGPPYSFTNFPGHGTLWPLSSGRFGNDVYFWSTTHGPARLRNGIDFEPLAAGRIQRALLDSRGSTARYSRIAARLQSKVLTPFFWKDEANGLVGWSYQAKEFEPVDHARYMSLVYDVHWDRWGALTLEDQGDATGEVLMAGKADLTDGRSALEQVRAFHSGKVFNTQRTVAPLSPIIKTSFISLSDPDQASTARPLRVRPVYSGTTDSDSSEATNFFSVEVESITRIHGSTDVNPNTTAIHTQRDKEDAIPVPDAVDARFHSVNLRPLRPSEEYSEIDGLEIEYTVSPGPGGRAR